MTTGAEGGSLTHPVVSTEEVVAGLNDLLQLDHDALGAYQIAIEQLADREHATAIEAFRTDHERHIQALNELIVGLGGAPRNEPHATAPLKEGLQKLAGVGGDRALLLAWRANELQVMATYEGYARRANAWPAEAKRLVDEHALDEERHYRWVAELLSDGETPEIDVLNRVRDGVAQARIAGARARERLEDVRDTARIRTADGLESAALRLDEVARREADAEGVRAHAADGAQRLARGLDLTAAHLRGGQTVNLRATLESEVVINPARTLIATFAVGFLIGRVLR